MRSMFNKKAKGRGVHSGKSSPRSAARKAAAETAVQSDMYYYSDFDTDKDGFDAYAPASDSCPGAADGYAPASGDCAQPAQYAQAPQETVYSQSDYSAAPLEGAEPENAADLEAQAGAKKTAKPKRPERSKKPAKEKKAAKTKESTPRPKLSTDGKIGIIVGIAVIALLFGAALAAGYAVSESENNFPNVYADGVYIGGMTQEEALQTLEESGWDKKRSTALRVKLISNVSFKVDRSAAGAKMSKEDAVRAAYAYGHSSNWLENLVEYVSNMVSPMDVGDANRSLNHEYIRQTVDSGIAKFLNATADRDYRTYDEEGLLVLVKGAGQMELDSNELCQKIEQALAEGEDSVVYMKLARDLQMPDFDALHTELAREPENAYYDPETYSVVDDIRGYNFDAAEAKRLWTDAAPAEKVKIPLEVTYPEVTGEEMRALLFRDVLGEQLTTYGTWDHNRVNNLHLAIEKINGVILNPGEVFSYNDVVGQRTEEAGFLPAGAYDDGQVVQEIGGGVCQVASTLYSATIFAQLKAVERTNHYFKVDYLDYGMDATVSWPKPNFRFENTRDYPVKIRAFYNDEYDYGVGAMQVELLGTDVDGSYVKVRRETWTISHPEFPDVPIGLSVLQHRDTYAADGTLISSDCFDYLDEYYKHEEAYMPQVEARRNALAGNTEGEG